MANDIPDPYDALNDEIDDVELDDAPDVEALDVDALDVDGALIDTDELDGDVDLDDEALEEGELSPKDSAAARQRADEQAEAEALSVTAKMHQRQKLEEEIAAFLARGGQIVEVPPDDSLPH